MYLWDPPHSSFNAAESLVNKSSLQSLAPIWSFHAPAGFSAAPTVVDGIAYVGDWSGYFYAIRVFDKVPLWRQFLGMAATPGNPECQPAIGIAGQAVVANGVVYAPGGDSAVYALSQRSGSVLWRVSLADPKDGAFLWSSITLVSGSLYIGIASLGDCPVVRGAIARIDIANPQKPAYFYLAPEGQLGGGVWSTPAVDPQTNTVFATTGNGTYDPNSGFLGGVFVALDGATFKTKSYFELPSNNSVDDMDWGSSPTLFHASDNTPLIAATAKDGVLYCLKRADMSQFWTRQIAMPCDCPECGCGGISTPAYDGQRLYLGAGKMDPDDSNNGSLYAFDPTTGGTVWSRTLPDTILAPVTIVNGIVFASTLGGLAAFDADTGQSLWDDGGRGPLYSQPVVLDGRVFTTYLSGEMVVWGLPGDDPAPAVSPRHPLH